MTQLSNDLSPDLAGERLIRAAELRTLLGGVSNMFVHRRLQDDPSFPRPLRIGSNRFWRVADVMAYFASKREAA